MRTVASHSTQTKKSYRKPVLSKLGSVTKLTKGKAGSAEDLDGDFDFSED
ncbi:lasso RiPP family leader peptide-containing protein [Dyadobacter arcticus]|uniref:Lasso RiPP family leader peptide-containing protein n=1 Tax=Dyadobacter arcticus TaxID=1078754 RepID=A0ABX0UF16_9BACT|nr:lasso RiPP family leader peptide-containing protein [Dyadobacter arcticus]NIJ51507.1 hypothetical protein [Dyadobacter arcticus]